MQELAWVLHEYGEAKPPVSWGAFRVWGLGFQGLEFRV